MWLWALRLPIFTVVKQLLVGKSLYEYFSVAAPFRSSCYCSISSVFLHCFSRNSEGLFSVYNNSILIASHSGTRLFHWINNIQNCRFSIGPNDIQNETNVDLFFEVYQIHFSKSLDDVTIRKVHFALMDKFNI